MLRRVAERVLTAGNAVTIRPAVVADAPAVAAIFAPYVAETVISFRESAPTVGDWERSIAAAMVEGMPFLVAAGSGRVLGYAHAAAWKPYDGYRYTVEDSVYVDRDLLGRGIGRALLAALIEACRDAGFEQMIAVISHTADVGAASIGLHRRLGFVDIGTLRKVGTKHGVRIDTHVMQLSLRSQDVQGR